MYVALLSVRPIGISRLSLPSGCPLPLISVTIRRRAWGPSRDAVVSLYLASLSILLFFSLSRRLHNSTVLLLPSPPYTLLAPSSPPSLTLLRARENSGRGCSTGRTGTKPDYLRARERRLLQENSSARYAHTHTPEWIFTRRRSYTHTHVQGAPKIGPTVHRASLIRKLEAKKNLIHFRLSQIVEAIHQSREFERNKDKSKSKFFSDILDLLEKIKVTTSSLARVEQRVTNIFHKIFYKYFKFLASFFTIPPHQIFLTESLSNAFFIYCSD